LTGIGNQAFTHNPAASLVGSSAQFRKVYPPKAICPPAQSKNKKEESMSAAKVMSEQKPRQLSNPSPNLSLKNSGSPACYAGNICGYTPLLTETIAALEHQKVMRTGAWFTWFSITACMANVIGIGMGAICGLRHWNISVGRFAAYTA
jgi:hypothetical protein